MDGARYILIDDGIGYSSRVCSCDIHIVVDLIAMMFSVVAVNVVYTVIHMIETDVFASVRECLWCAIYSCNM